jgi:hypothetical protein
MFNGIIQKSGGVFSPKSCPLCFRFILANLFEIHQFLNSHLIHPQIITIHDLFHFFTIEQRHFQLDTEHLIDVEKFKGGVVGGSGQYQEATFWIGGDAFNENEYGLHESVVIVWPCLHVFHQSLNVVQHDQRLSGLVGIVENLGDRVDATVGTYPNESLRSDYFDIGEVGLFGKVAGN